MNSIAPGAIRTPIKMSAWSTPEAYNELMALIPYKRIGEPEDIGRAAVWLASDYADYMTGTSLIIDGLDDLVSRFCNRVMIESPERVRHRSLNSAPPVR